MSEPKQQKQMEPTRVTVREITERMKRNESFTFIDARRPDAWEDAEAKLPEAIRVPADEAGQHLSQIPKDRVVITYCTCPNEASSAGVAQLLLNQGWKNVHPLYGGFDAWQKAGAPVEPK